MKDEERKEFTETDLAPLLVPIIRQRQDPYFVWMDDGSARTMIKAPDGGMLFYFIDGIAKLPPLPSADYVGKVISERIDGERRKALGMEDR